MIILPDVDVVSAKVHDAWMKKNLEKGITSRKSASTGEEFMVPYDQLSEDAKDSDRITVRAVYAAIEELG
jgi:hypothetical protein